MDAPEKIYITDFGSELSFDWHREYCAENDIEYTRTDVLIDKASKFIKDNGNFYIDIVNEQLVLKESIIKDFIKYMKGE